MLKFVDLSVDAAVNRLKVPTIREASAALKAFQQIDEVTMKLSKTNLSIQNQLIRDFQPIFKIL